METITEVKERPILFSTPMVKAILEGRKTVTRRVVKHHLDDRGVRSLSKPFEDWHGYEVKCPYGKPGDIVWVRETWSRVTVVNSTTFESHSEFRYKADHRGAIIKGHDRFKPSIHMPKSACRLRLEIQSIRVERLQDITEEDAFREGIDADNEDYSAAEHYQLGGSPIQGGSPARFAFIALWQRINGAESWDDNPWVFVINFRKL